MKLLTKLTLLALAVSALPVALAGYFSLRIGQGALRGALEENELTVAKQVAGYASSYVDNLLSILRVDARIFDLTRSGQDQAPSPQALLKFLQLVYHQSDDFCAVAMFDEHGTLVGQPAYLENPARYDAFRNHEPMRPTDVEGVGLMAPLGAALSGGQGMGPIFLGGPTRFPHVVLAVAFDPKLGGGKRILAAEVSLKRLANYVTSLSSADVDVKLIDARARLFAAGSRGGAANLETLRVPGGGREGELPGGEIVAEYAIGGRRLIGAYAPVAPWGLGAVVDKTVDAALRPVDRIRFATWLWIGLAMFVSSIAARILARRLAVRVAALATGSHQIAAGNLETRIPEEGRDELAELAGDFNKMATALDGARKKITQQTNEILAWNQTLEKRVEEKTTELRQAQDLLLRSRSLSALGRARCRRRARDQQPAHGGARHRAAADRRLAPGASSAAAARRSGAGGAPHPEDRAEHAPALAAAERSRHHPGRRGPRSRRRGRAVRPHRACRRGHRGGTEIRGDSAGARQCHSARGSFHSADPEWTHRHEVRRQADARGKADRGFARAHRHQRHGNRHQPREPPPHLRPVLHDQGRRSRVDRARPVVRAPDRRGQRRHDSGGELARRRDQVHADVPSRFGAGAPAMKETTTPPVRAPTTPSGRAALAILLVAAAPSCRQREIGGDVDMKPAAMVASASAPAVTPPAAPPAAVDAGTTFEVTSATGTVEAQREGRWVALQPGAKLTRSDVVRTAAASTAVLRLDAGTEIELRAGVEIGLDRLPGGASVDLRRGKVLARVSAKEALSVTARQTRTTNEGPARFVVLADARGRVSVAALEGKAQFSAAGKSVALSDEVEMKAPCGSPYVGAVDNVARGWPGARCR